MKMERKTSFTHCSVDLDIEYWFTPAEKETRDTPGYSATVEITKVEHKGVDMTELLEYVIIDLEDILYDKLVNNEEI